VMVMERGDMKVCFLYRVCTAWIKAENGDARDDLDLWRLV